jgi:hypothetical protein
MRLRPAGPAMAKVVEETLAPVLEGQIRADAAAGHLVAGEAQALAGNKEAARSHFRAAWVEHPLSAAAPGAKLREQALGSGVNVAPIPVEKLVRRAEILLDANRNREAVDQLSRLKLQPLCTFGCPGDKTVPALLKAALSVLLARALSRRRRPTRPTRSPAARASRRAGRCASCATTPRPAPTSRQWSCAAPIPISGRARSTCSRRWSRWRTAPTRGRSGRRWAAASRSRRSPTTRSSTRRR